MRAADFLIETIAHFAKETEGPPPGVPFHADAEFETDLVALCRHQGLGGFVSESFDELALPPTTSRITIARIKHLAAETDALRRRRMRSLGRVCAAFDAVGIDYAVVGDAWTAHERCAAGRMRPVSRIDLMIDERTWMEAVRALRRLGFVRSRIQPHLAADQPERAAAAAMRYHHYFAPLLLHDHDGDVVGLRFRVVDFGHPERSNPAWERVRRGSAAGGEVRSVSPEDQLVHSVITFGAEGFVDLPLVLDIGLVLARYGRELDWRRVERTVRAKGLYPAFYFTLEHACTLLSTRRALAALERPPGWRRKLFRLWWRPDEADFSGETEPSSGRFVFNFIEGGGPAARAVWLWRSLFPRSAWVKSVYGRPSNLWLRVKFLFDVRSGRRRRAPDLAPDGDAGGAVAEFPGHRPWGGGR